MSDNVMGGGLTHTVLLTQDTAHYNILLFHCCSLSIGKCYNSARGQVSHYKFWGDVSRCTAHGLHLCLADSWLTLHMIAAC